MPEDGPRRDVPLWELPPERPALTVGDGATLPVAELVDRAGRVAAGLRAAGLAPGDRLVLLDTDPGTTIGAALAGIACGAFVVPVPASRAASPEAAALLSHPRTTCVIGRGDALPVGRPGVPLDGDVAGLVVDLRVVADAGARETSGHADATASTLFPDVLGLPPAGSVLVLLPHLHVFALRLVLALLHGQRHVVVPGAPTAGGVRDALAAHGCAGLVTTAPALGALLGDGLEAAALRHVVSLGRVAPDVRPRLAAALGADRLVEYYDDGGVETLAAPPGSSLAGFWSRTAAGDDSSIRADAERLAAAFAAEPERPWVAVLDQGAEVLAATLAAALGGGSLLVASPAGDVAHLVRTSGARGVLTSGPLVARVAEAVPGVPVTVFGDVEGGPLPIGRAGALVPYTSGTTGPPKVVVRDRRPGSPALDGARWRSFAMRFGLAGDGQHLVTLPLHQPAALYFALLALHGGQSLVLMDTWAPRAALDHLRDDGVTTAFMVPSMFASLLRLTGARDETFPGLRAVVHSTAPCPVEVKRAMLDWWGPVLYDCYSPTEVLGTYALPGEWLARPGTVGKALPGGEVVVRDADGRDCRPGEEGRVFLRDAGFRYADGSQPWARDRGFVAVGDVGYLDEDGWLYLTGRMSDYISVGGSKFHPSVVEDVLATVDGVAECALTALPDARLGHVPVALVVPLAGVAPRELRAAVLAHARAVLARERVPLKVVVTSSLPRDEYGKLRRRDLPPLAGQ